MMHARVRAAISAVMLPSAKTVRMFVTPHGSLTPSCQEYFETLGDYRGQGVDMRLFIATCALDAIVFGVGNSASFANDFAGNLPTTDVNVVVLETFDDDNNPATPFGAGNAANLIADRITTPGPGFFVYFNQGLDLPRLVFSTDLSDNSADLKVLARMLNLTGASGRDAMQTFTASNFAFTTESTAVPEPSTLLLLGAGMVGAGRRWRRRTVDSATGGADNRS